MQSRDHGLQNLENLSYFSDTKENISYKFYWILLNQIDQMWEIL